MNPGARLGRFEILSRIGAGGMGEVFKARDTLLNRNVAIKILPRGFADDAQSRTRFEREARAISQLNHPHICTLHDVGHDEGLIYLVMEYIEGESLADKISRGPLPLEEVVRYGAEIADALSRAHASGVVHRDLKPSNVMITGSGAKLLDFGLAKVVVARQMPDSESPTIDARDNSLTADGLIVGTLQYMSPEQLQDQPVGTNTDIFALGMLLYEMITGRRAFEGDSRASIIAAILKSEPPPLQSVAPATPHALDRLIRKCLQKDPGQRWQSARDLADELRWVLEDGSTGQRVPLPPPRRPMWPVWVAVAIVAVAAALLWRYADEWLVNHGPPRVVLMDSTNPERVYSSITRANGGTNSDDLTGVLRDLPVTLVKETTSALWNREDQIVKEKPTLIIMHRGSFAPSHAIVADPKLFKYGFTLGERKVEAFIGYVGLANPRSKFIVYSRDWSDAGGGSRWVSELQGRFPHLRGRVLTVQATGRPEPSFRDPASAANMRRNVIRLLDLDGRAPVQP